MSTMDISLRTKDTLTQEIAALLAEKKNRTFLDAPITR